MKYEKRLKVFSFFKLHALFSGFPMRAFQSTDDIEAVSELAKRLTPRFSITAS